jgi:radical SAM/Cys-rich protein
MKTPLSDNPFLQTLQEQRLELTRETLRIVQLNVGLVCDLACRHCHLEAGPTRSEIMTRTTMEQVLELLGRTRPALVDITGGAPELVPELPWFLKRLAEIVPRVMLRSNLTALSAPERDELLNICVEQRIVLVASFPALSASQADSQRGSGVHDRSLAMLRRLNALGYGRDGSGLELNLVSNPAGAFLPAGQQAQERRFKQDLARRHGIAFNQLFTFANMPLGRFRAWLEATDNYAAYLGRLKEHFNAATLDGLMCRNLVSISWDGFLYDCDFNLAAGIWLGSQRTHISAIEQLPGKGEPIATGEHCFACTAGSGFT